MLILQLENKKSKLSVKKEFHLNDLHELVEFSSNDPHNSTQLYAFPSETSAHIF